MNNQIQLVLKSSTTELSLNDHELGIYLVPELDGLTGLPEIRTTSGVNSGYDGGWTSAQHYDARSITIRGVIANTDVATVERLRKQLVSLAGQGKQEELTLDLVTEAGNAYTLQVRTIALEMAMKGVLEKQEFMLQLRADDPLIYDNAESTHEAYIQVSKATGGFTINFDLPLAITGGSEETVISNDGLEQVPTITRMYGALHNPKIINQTTNQSMQINADLGFSEGQWVDASEVVTGKTINIEDAPDNAPLASFRLDGETSQNGTPTPSAPVPVQTVTGENVVNICRKNLLSNELRGTVSITGASIVFSGSFITINRTTGAVGYNIKTNTLTYAIASGQELAFSMSYKSGTINTNGTYTWRFGVYGIKADGTSERFGDIALPYNTTTPSASTTCTATSDYVGFALGCYLSNATNTTTGDVVFDCQLELGSTATAYEPYQGQSYEVNLGKNLYNPSTTTTTGYTNQNVRNEIGIYPGETYTFNITNSRTWATVYLYNGSGAQTRTLGNTAASNLITFTASSSEVKAALVFYAGNNTDVSTYDFTGVQLEKGSTATSYAAYFTPIELCKIGTYQDSIYKSDGKWYVHKAVGKEALSSSDNWGVRSDVTISDCTVFVNLDYVAGSFATNSQAYSSHFMYASSYSSGAIRTINANGYGLSPVVPNSITGIAGGDDVSTKVTKFKTWLGNNTVSVYYIALTSTDTEITNEALIAQLETLLNTARTYAGVNNIFTVTPNEQGTLEISYYTHKTADNRDEIVIDSRLRTVTLNGLDIYHLIETGSEFLMLAPGENKLSLQSDITGDNGYAEVSYKQGYLSI